MGYETPFVRVFSTISVRVAMWMFVCCARTALVCSVIMKHPILVLLVVKRVTLMLEELQRCFQKLVNYLPKCKWLRFPLPWKCNEMESFPLSVFIHSQLILFMGKIFKD